jgi:hypothetical protein
MSAKLSEEQVKELTETMLIMFERMGEVDMKEFIKRLSFRETKDRGKELCEHLVDLIDFISMEGIIYTDYFYENHDDL